MPNELLQQRRIWKLFNMLPAIDARLDDSLRDIKHLRAATLQPDAIPSRRTFRLINVSVSRLLQILLDDLFIDLDTEARAVGDVEVAVF